MTAPTPPVFATFKYQHKDAPRLTDKRQRAYTITLVVALIVATVGFPLGLLALLVPVLVRITVPRQICLGPRYLLCGNTVVYYANISSLRLNTIQGIMKIKTDTGSSFTLERERFPTNARKADKIGKNKTQKFNKVAYKIVDKVRRAAPDAALDLP